MCIVSTRVQNFLSKIPFFEIYVIYVCARTYVLNPKFELEYAANLVYCEVKCHVLRLLNFHLNITDFRYN